MATISNDQLLASGIKHSQLLLSYIAENGIDIDEKQINILTKAKYLEEESKWTAEEESKFWHTYQQIVKLIHPVTINSLLATIEQPLNHPNFFQRFFNTKIKHAKAHIAVRTYASLAILSIIIMLLLQIYSVVGSTLLKSIEHASNRMKTIELQMSDLSLIDKSNNKRTSVQLGMLQSEFEELENEKNSSIELLKYWHKLEFLHFFPNNKAKIENKELENFPGGPGSPIDAANYIEKVNIIQSASNMNLILNIYVLPLLYGLMGSFAFVLRNLTTEIKEMLFSKESQINYTLRISLGALLGLIVGLFWGDSSSVGSSFIANLPPLGVAFLAGYSVEFLFKLFDNIIAMILKTNAKAGTSKK